MKHSCPGRSAKAAGWVRPHKALGQVAEVLVDRCLFISNLQISCSCRWISAACWLRWGDFCTGFDCTILWFGCRGCTQVLPNKMNIEKQATNNSSDMFWLYWDRQFSIAFLFLTVICIIMFSKWGRHKSCGCTQSNPIDIIKWINDVYPHLI